MVEHNTAGGEVWPHPPCVLPDRLLAPPPCRGCRGSRGSALLLLDLASSVRALGEKKGVSVGGFAHGCSQSVHLMVIFVLHFFLYLDFTIGVSRIVESGYDISDDHVCTPRHNGAIGFLRQRLGVPCQPTRDFE